MAAPSAFSGHLEKWILTRCKDSIFFIKIVPKEHQIKAIRMRMHLAGKQEEQLDDLAGEHCTSFVVAQNRTYLKILTCAHIIEHVFKGSLPISADDANSLFDTYVLCDHCEMSFRQPDQGIYTGRIYVPAKILAINCVKDLLLLQVEQTRIMNLNRVCRERHPSLSLSPNPPEQYDECVMVSWPLLQHRTAVRGSISHCFRGMHEIAHTNPVEYGMDLLQVNIASEKGSSGAPLLDSGGNIIGLLHGGCGGQFSYFVSLGDIKSFLTQTRCADLVNSLPNNLR